MYGNRELTSKARTTILRRDGETLSEYVRRIEYEIRHFENQSTVHLNWHTHNDKRGAGECWICNILLCLWGVYSELEHVSQCPDDIGTQGIVTIGPADSQEAEGTHPPGHD